MHDVLPERVEGARSLTSSLAEWTLIPYDLAGGCTFSVPSLERRTAGSAPVRAQLQASRCCQLCPKHRSKALWASSSQEPSHGSCGQRSRLDTETTYDRPEVSPTRPAPLLVHVVLPERDVGARSLTRSLAQLRPRQPCLPNLHRTGSLLQPCTEQNIPVRSVLECRVERSNGIPWYRIAQRPSLEGDLVWIS